MYPGTAPPPVPARDMRVSCTIYTKTPAPDGTGFHYRMANLRNWDGSGHLSTFHPPNVGDLICVHDDQISAATTWCVTGRDWLHNTYGSRNWPLGEQHPITGPMLTLIVEPGQGLFVDQVPDPDEPE